EIRLARARRADPEGDRAAADRVDVPLLVDGLRCDPLAAVAPDDVFEDVAEILGLIDGREHRVDRVRADVVAALDELDELVDDCAGLGDARLLALDRQLVAAEADRATQPVAQRLEHAVADPGQLGGDLVRDGENLLHARKCRAPSGGCRRRRRARLGRMPSMPSPAKGAVAGASAALAWVAVEPLLGRA